MSNKLDIEDDQELSKIEERLVEDIKEWLWNDEAVQKYIRQRIEFHWLKSYGLSDKKQLSDFEEEFICQVQVLTMNELLAKVMVG